MRKFILTSVTVGGTGTCITRYIFPFSLEPRVLRLFRPLDRNCTVLSFPILFVQF